MQNIRGLVDIFMFSTYNVDESLYAFMHMNDVINERMLLNIESGGTGWQIVDFPTRKQGTLQLFLRQGATCLIGARNIGGALGAVFMYG